MAKMKVKFDKQKIKDLKLIPAGGGAFELSVDGELLYSKLKTHQFPDEQKMLDYSKLVRQAGQRISVLLGFQEGKPAKMDDTSESPRRRRLS